MRSFRHGHLTGSAQQCYRTVGIERLAMAPFEQDQGEALGGRNRRRLDRFIQQSHAFLPEIGNLRAEDDHGEEPRRLSRPRRLDLGDKGRIDPGRHRGKKPLGECLGGVLVPVVRFQGEGTEQRARILLATERGSRKNQREPPAQDQEGPGRRPSQRLRTVGTKQIHEFDAPGCRPRIFSMVARRNGPIPVQFNPDFKAAASAAEPFRSSAKA